MLAQRRAEESTGAGVSSKREREYARRRAEKWQAHVETAQAKERQRRRFGGIVLAALVLAGVAWIVWTVIGSFRDQAELSSVMDELNSAAATATDGATDTATDGATDTATADPTAAAPDPSIAEDRTWTATITTSAGDLTLSLDGHAAPQAVAAFVTLAQDGFFEQTTCHRLTTADAFKLLQCGDPNGDGTGGPDFRFGPIENAPADDVYPAGTVAMARVSGDAYSMGSQFFLVYGDSTIPADSAGGYTVLGTITSGLDVLQQVADAGVEDGTETPVTKVTIEKVEVE
ncbi:peptidylprolyl isomerase [Actinotalea sp. M2MS4P-6]|uniref:peptidylprolyl isomerase n=1 Tax=Actinotalea sp. M2MS4P-6 TaxID=2983762 RepID=UPI0021E375B2|nr:peptidylprolyl isomerase [Actinotalea sp. M2MS4P-6]MCV2394539.1 peptidylprolyl isomerase [Actinotalea sp. M2MS4P-6]